MVKKYKLKTKVLIKDLKDPSILIKMVKAYLNLLTLLLKNINL
jgi:hypothetical protein